MTTRFTTFGYSLLVTWGLLLQGHFTRISKIGSLRSLVFLWALFSLLFSTSFSSNLMSNFTRPPLTPKPKSVADLVNMGYSSPVILHSSSPMRIVLNKEDPVNVEWIERNYKVSTFDEYLEILRSDPKSAILGQIFNSADYFITYTPHGTPNDVLNMYESMETCVATVYEAFAFRQGSPFLVPINEYMENLASSGLLGKFTDDILTEVALTFPAVRYVEQSSSSRSELRPLSVTHLKGVFLALGVGYVLSILVFLGELIFHYYLGVNNDRANRMAPPSPLIEFIY